MNLPRQPAIPSSKLIQASCCFRLSARAGTNGSAAHAQLALQVVTKGGAEEVPLLDSTSTDLPRPLEVARYLPHPLRETVAFVRLAAPSTAADLRGMAAAHPAWSRARALVVLMPSRARQQRGKRGDDEERELAAASLERLLTLLADSPQRPHLLIASPSSHQAQIRELSLRDGRVIGHELLCPYTSPSGVASRSARRQSRRDRASQLLDYERLRITSKCLTHHVGTGCVDLQFSSAALPKDAPTTVRVLFRFDDSERERELSAWLGPRASSKKWEEFDLTPEEHGALLELRPFADQAADIFSRSLHATPSERVRAVISNEREHVAARRKQRARHILAADHPHGSSEQSGARVHSDPPWHTGLALSGGGIRSATVSIGFMRGLQDANELAAFDYASSVSGGSYANGYLQAMTSPQILAQMGIPRRDGNLLTRALDDESIAQLLQSGRYLAMGSGVRGIINVLRLGTSFLTSLLQHWLWLVAVLTTSGLLFRRLEPLLTRATLVTGALALALVLLRIPLREYHRARIWKRKTFLTVDGHVNAVETFTWCSLLLLVAGLSLESVPERLATLAGVDLGSSDGWTPFVISLGVTFLLTLITSPNSTSLHRYYSTRLADAFLRRLKRSRDDEKAAAQPSAAEAKSGNSAVYLRDLAHPLSIAPYPLFDGCVNLIGKDSSFVGQRTSDYFVFAPDHCGAKLTGYAPTARGSQYGLLTLADAITCSGAAISPFQGRSMPSLMSTILWLFNLRTDLWLPNPARPRTGWRKALLGDQSIPWGPLLQLRALWGKLDTHASFVNVSDGAFIDSLGVYELLRRRCRIIVAVDATLDPQYDFHDLRNLVLRARQELKITFQFEESPERSIRPCVADGASESCVARAAIEYPDAPPGILFYVKTALPKEDGMEREGSKAADVSLAYRTYYPAFPHESTGDQFFDPVQWDAYYSLGRILASKLLDHADWKSREQRLSSFDRDSGLRPSPGARAQAAQLSTHAGDAHGSDHGR